MDNKLRTEQANKNIHWILVEIRTRFTDSRIHFLLRLRDQLSTTTIHTDDRK